MEDIDFFFFFKAGEQSEWVQATSSKWPPSDCGLNITSVFKAFAILFGYVLHVHLPGASLGPGQ